MEPGCCAVIVMFQISVDRNKLQEIQNPWEETYYGVYVSKSFGFGFFF